MNIEEIDKWLDNEYGCSYTRLEELHDYFFERYTDQKEEIERLNNIINELENYFNKIKDTSTLEERMIAKYMLKYIKELKGSDDNE